MGVGCQVGNGRGGTDGGRAGEIGEGVCFLVASQGGQGTTAGSRDGPDDGALEGVGVGGDGVVGINVSVSVGGGRIDGMVVVMIVIVMADGGEGESRSERSRRRSGIAMEQGRRWWGDRVRERMWTRKITSSVGI